MNTIWKQNGITFAGGNGKGNQLNQLDTPQGMCFDNDDQCVYIADYYNHCIVKWEYGGKNGEVVAGGKGPGNQMNQLNRPTDVIIDKKSDSFIISDYGNRRVLRWPRRNNTNRQIIISDIDCYRLTMDNNGDLYVSDDKKKEVRRWKDGETNGTLVAGGNGQRNNLNQLNRPISIFIDQDYSVYVSDYNNNRVMKWMKDAKEGIVDAGGQGRGNSLSQLSQPQGLIVDHLGNIYVADSWNNRIMRWSKESKQGTIVVGGNGRGEEPNQFYGSTSLLFDRQGNLYVVDLGNNRVQQFDVDSK